MRAVESANAAMADERKNHRRLTPIEAAKRIGVSAATVWRLEKRGELPPYTDHNGRTRYAVTDVERVAAKRTRGGRSPGDVAALAFRLFEEGESLPRVVIECARGPREIRALHAEWLAMRDADVRAPIPPAGPSGAKDGAP